MVFTKKIDRNTLVDIAYDLLESEGIEAVSMRRLAQMLDVKAASLYHHFTDKTALLSAVAEKGFAQLADVLERTRTQAGADPRQQVRAMGMAYREWALQHARLYLLLFGDVPLWEHPSPITQAVADPILATVAQMVGEQRSVAATQTAWAFVHGFVMLELTDQMRRGTPAEGFQFGLEVLISGLSNEGNLI